MVLDGWTDWRESNELVDGKELRAGMRLSPLVVATAGEYNGRVVRSEVSCGRYVDGA